MKFAAIAVTLAGLIIPPFGIASGQTGTNKSYVHVQDNQLLIQSCQVQQGPSVTTSATCPPSSLSDGFGSGTASADNSTRHFAVDAQVSLQNTAGSLYGATASEVTMFGTVDITGGSGNAAFLAFRFLSDASLTAVGGSPSLSAFWGVNIEGPSNTGGGISVLRSADGATTTNDNATAQFTSDGFDIFLELVQLPTTFDYRIFAQAVVQSAYVRGGLPAGAGASAALSATLQGIDVVTRDHQILNSAIFDPSGRASITVVSTTPEPATLVLLGSGMIGLGVFVRRRTTIS